MDIFIWIRINLNWSFVPSLATASESSDKDATTAPSAHSTRGLLLAQEQGKRLRTPGMTLMCQWSGARRIKPWSPASCSVATRKPTVTAAIHGEVVSGKVEPGVNEHGSVSSREDETITVDPVRVGSIILKLWRDKSETVDSCQIAVGTSFDLVTLGAENPKEENDSFF